MLGKGLESLIPKKGGNLSPAPNENNSHRDKNFHYNRHHREKNFNENRSAVFHIEVEKIKPNPYQPRKTFDEENLYELMQSIRQFGIIQPVVVSKVEIETDGGTTVEYQLIVGERRLLAAKKVGLPRIPAIVRNVGDNKLKFELALIENLQRSNLNPLETARAYARLQDEFNLTQRQIAERVGKSRESVANTLRILQLSQEIQEALRNGKINESHARTLLALSDPEEQKKAFEKALLERASARTLRESIDSKEKSEETYWEKQLEEHLGATVRIVKRGERGRMVIPFYSQGELKNLLEKILGDVKDL